MRTLELKKTTGELKDGMHSACAFLNTEDAVTRALTDNLIDEQLLGDDYTLTATRQQVASIAKRLIKEMTGKDANEGKLNLFADIAGGNLDMNAAVTRQEMATPAAL